MENVIVENLLKSNEDKIIVNDYIENEPLSEENLDKTLKYLHEIRLSRRYNEKKSRFRQNKKR